jgi:hypothetical protein
VNPLIRRALDQALRLPVPGSEPAVGSENSISRVVVFGKFPNPTFDYYFAARLAAQGMPEFELIDIRNFDQGIEARGAFIIIVRYASFSVTRWIKKNRAALAGVAVFVDDDIAAAITAPQASLRYRYRLLRQSILPLRVLDGLIDDLWVSTEVLSQRLSYAKPRLLGPAPNMNAVQLFTTLRRSDVSSAILIAYHATAIHAEEHHFLITVMKSVLTERPSVCFEVIATGKSADMWRELACDRIMVKAPLGWEDYLKSQDKQIDIMVVPVAPGRLNDCRAETKRIDIARVGAAAVMSYCPAFIPGEPGEILLPYEEAVWAQNLIHLIDDANARKVAAMSTRLRVEHMARQAATGIARIKERV